MDPQWDDSVPIYRQLRDRVVAMILEGALKEGDPLPSVRSVAAEFRLNPLTVLKGYQQLVDEQLVEKGYTCQIILLPEQAGFPFEDHRAKEVFGGDHFVQELGERCFYKTGRASCSEPNAEQAERTGRAAMVDAVALSHKVRSNNGITQGQVIDQPVERRGKVEDQLDASAGDQLIFLPQGYERRGAECPVTFDQVGQNG